MNQLPRGVKKIIVACMGRERAHTLSSTVNKWLRCSGPEWTVKRLKALRTGALHLRAGNRSEAITIWQQNSVSYNHGTAIPKGVYSSVIMDYVHATTAQSLKRLDAILRIYTSIRCNTLTHAQFMKAKKAINAPCSANEKLIAKLQSNIFDYIKELRIGERELLPVDVSRLSAFSNTHSEHPNDCEITKDAWGRLVRSLWTSAYLPASVISHNPAEVMRSLLIESGADNTFAGHISFIQEGGCKARVVAVPNAWCQGIFQTLHQHLASLATRFPQSCMHDQNKGAYFMQAQLNEGKTLFCFDLSSATDRFPIQLQQAVLEGLGLSDWSLAFGEISKAPWRVKTRVDGAAVDEIWHYQTGQPMGLYGSFPLFHLTHILLLGVLAKEVGTGPEETFRVLGDDVIISDPSLAKIYERTLHHCGVEVSPAKTIISDHLAEFAGFLAHRTTQGIFVYRPYKYSPSGDFVSPVNLLDALGNKCKKLGNYWARKYNEFVFTKPWRNPDLSPILQEDDQDEGKTPPGLNSHLLGSLSNKFSRALAYEPSQHLLEVYEAQQLLLLGQKERVTPSGFASANLNPEGIFIPQADEKREFSPSLRLSNDPLMRESSTGELRDKGKGITKTDNGYCLTSKLDL